MKTYKEYIKEITIISFEKTMKDIANFKSLPKDVQEFINKEVKTINASGFQELQGFSGSKIIISLGGYWKDSDGKFYINSWGINKKGYTPKTDIENYDGKI